MGIHLSIPGSVAQVLRLSRDKQHQRLASELAVALYDQGILPFGKARELAGMTKYEFGILLGKRQVVRHYTDEDLQDDVAYAHRK